MEFKPTTGLWTVLVSNSLSREIRYLSNTDSGQEGIVIGKTLGHINMRKPIWSNANVMMKNVDQTDTKLRNLQLSSSSC